MRNINFLEVELEVYEYPDEDGIIWCRLGDKKRVACLNASWGQNISKIVAYLLSAAPDLFAAAKHALPGCVGESAKLLKNAIAKAEAKGDQNMTEKKEIDDGGMVYPDPALFAEAHGAIRVHDLSKREYFAAKAPPMTSQWWLDSKGRGHWLEANATWCVAHADAMIKALKK